MDEATVKDLIEALSIFSKYVDDGRWTSCEHDVLYVCVDPNAVSTTDKARLDQLGFLPGEADGNFYSYRHGSC